VSGGEPGLNSREIEHGESYLYVAVLRDCMKDMNWVLELNPGRDSGKRCLRVGRISRVRNISRIFGMCSFREKMSLLRGYTRKYASDGVRSRLEVGLALERELIHTLRREGWTVANRPPVSKWKVYVIELDPAVRKHRGVLTANPCADPRKSCLYIGQTGREIAERYMEHQSGGGKKRGARFLEGNCVRLREDIYTVFNPMPQLESLVLERELALELREEGYTVLGGH
jgi:hypothetical protein